VLQFELANVPSQFMRIMNWLVASNPGLCEFVAVYDDDVLIGSSTREEHLDHVRLVLDLLQKAGLKLKRSKWEWFCDENKFCGVQINQEGVHTLDSKTRAVTECPWPRNTKEVRGFLVLTGYYGKFIRHYSHIAFVLYRMCKMRKIVKIGGHRGELRLVLAPVPFLDCFYYSGYKKTRNWRVRFRFLPNGSLNYVHQF